MLTWLLIAVGAIVLLRKFSSTATPTETPPAAKPTGSPPYPAPPGMQWVWVQQPYMGPWSTSMNWGPGPQPYAWHLVKGPDYDPDVLKAYIAAGGRCDNGYYPATTATGAPAPQPAPGEIIVQPTGVPTWCKPQGETADEVPVNKTGPFIL
jgi:hypothetical protein